jgi:hypothetical protein
MLAFFSAGEDFRFIAVGYVINNIFFDDFFFEKRTSDLYGKSP